MWPALCSTPLSPITLRRIGQAKPAGDTGQRAHTTEHSGKPWGIFHPFIGSFTHSLINVADGVIVKTYRKVSPNQPITLDGLDTCSCMSNYAHCLMHLASANFTLNLTPFMPRSLM